jgi:hypothetical protein
MPQHPEKALAGRAEDAPTVAPTAASNRSKLSFNVVMLTFSDDAGFVAFRRDVEVAMVGSSYRVYVIRSVAG